jgi:hypothetical protein
MKRPWVPTHLDLRIGEDFVYHHRFGSFGREEKVDSTIVSDTEKRQEAGSGGGWPPSLERFVLGERELVSKIGTGGQLGTSLMFRR